MTRTTTVTMPSNFKGDWNHPNEVSLKTNYPTDKAEVLEFHGYIVSEDEEVYTRTFKVFVGKLEDFKCTFYDDYTVENRLH